MSARLTRVLVALGLVLVLGFVDARIVGKERIIRGGETIYLELAPVDPRSLMQGDYLALRFRLAEQIDEWRLTDARTRVRRAPLRMDERGIATLASDAGTMEIAFRVRRGGVWLGTNAYFFEEGTGDRFDGARFGEFRIDRSSGEAVLVGLRDADLNPL
jgi:uncharacterized membrane-anchored protein